MKEKEVTKIGDYEIKRYYQDGDFFIDLEYHYEEDDSRDMGEVVTYIGDKTDLKYGCVMKLAAFICHAQAMKPEFILNAVENILGNGLHEYDYYKHFLFQSDLEEITDVDRVYEVGWCDDVYEYYPSYECRGHMDREIKMDLAEELKLKRYKYGKYIFDIVIHNISDGKCEVDTYMFEKNNFGKILCNRSHWWPEENTDDAIWREYLEREMNKHKILYKNPSQIRITDTGYEEIYRKSYR